jgi:hypothetical protein
MPCLLRACRGLFGAGRAMSPGGRLLTPGSKVFVSPMHHSPQQVRMPPELFSPPWRPPAWNFHAALEPDLRRRVNWSPSVAQ